MMKRRNFLKLSGAAGAAFAFTPADAMSLFPNKKIKNFGLQLYTLRDVLPDDPAGILKQVAAAGYKYIEPYTHDKLGMFWGMSNKEFKKFNEDLGMKVCSIHTDVYKDFEKKVEECAAIGIDYIIYAWEGSDRKLDDYKRFADEFNKKGEVCKQHGVRFAFHNHDYSFRPLDGQLGQKVMLDGTDPSLVYFEMDMYWVVTAGQDPVEWMKNYPNRFRLCHVKDRAKNATDNADTCTLGTGIIDYQKILSEAKKYGMDYFIVEQEKYAGTTPLQCIKDNAAYMKALSV
ncbi:MAG: sugar phosphate isomerase/epimerase [Ferruginibacter sp.]